MGALLSMVKREAETTILCILYNANRFRLFEILNMENAVYKPHQLHRIRRP